MDEAQIAAGILADDELVRYMNESMQVLDADHSWRKYQVHYSPRVDGPWEVRNFSIPRRAKSRLTEVRDSGPERDPGYGDGFTKIVHVNPDTGKRTVWMSDTRAEIREHYPFFEAMDRMKKGSGVLINGLGIGMAALAAAKHPNVGHVDVVEIDEDVAGLIRSELPADRVTLHVNDAYAQRWPKGTRWAVAWHDIWPQIDDANLEGMNRLELKYRDRARWQGCWQRSACENMREIFDRMEAGLLPKAEAQQYLNGNWRRVFR